MYWVLDYDSDCKGVMIMNCSSSKKIGDINFASGAPVTDRLPLLEYKLEKGDKGEVLDYVWTAMSGMLISQKFRDVLDDLGITSNQYFPARISGGRGGKKYDNYYLLNVTERISCLDVKKSKVTRRGHAGAPAIIRAMIRSIDEMHLDYGKINEAKIFRLDEWSPLVICHSSVKQAVESVGLQGLKFSAVEGYSTDGND